MIKNIDLRLMFFSAVSAFIQSFAIINFTIPASLYPAGFSGISRLISDISGDFFSFPISYSVLYLGFNIIVSLFVFKKIGRKFTIYSIIQFTLVSFITMYLPRNFFVSDMLLLAVFGGIVNGLAVGIALTLNFSTGGFDFISVYFSNKFKKDIWNYTFLVNVAIIMIAGFIYDWERALYSIIFQFCSTQVIKLLNHRYTFKTLTIITKKPDEVADAILKQFRHVITDVNASGYFSKEKTTMLVSVVNTFQYHEIVRLILSVDNHAFINVQNTKEIYGNYYQKPLD